MKRFYIYSENMVYDLKNYSKGSIISAIEYILIMSVCLVIIMPFMFILKKSLGVK